MEFVFKTGKPAKNAANLCIKYETIFSKKDIGMIGISVKRTIINPGNAMSINIVTRGDSTREARIPEKYISPKTAEDKTHDGSCAAMVQAKGAARKGGINFRKTE